MDYSIWKLYKYGLTQNIVKTVLETTNSVFDLIILDKQSTVLKETNRKHALRQAIKATKENPEMFNEQLFDNPYILLHYGAPTAGLSRIIKKIDILTISQLREMSISEINSAMDTNIIRTIEKIKKSIIKFDSDKINKKQDIKNILMFNIFRLKKTSINKLVDTLKMFPEALYDELNVSINEVSSCLNELKKENYILQKDNEYYFPSNIYYKSEYDVIPKKDNSSINDQSRILLSDYLNRDFKDKDILLLRLNGKTLEEIGNVYSVSRERIRQRQVQILKKMPKIIEVNRYKKIFEKYSLTKKEFTALFNEKPEVYEFLSLVLKKGKQDTGEYILNTDKIPGSKKIEYLENHKYHFTRFGEFKKINKQEFTEEILYKYKENSFNSEELLKVYTQELDEYPNYNLAIENHRSLEGIAARSQYIINTNGRSFRYYDLTQTTDDTILKELIDNLDDGSYSMQKIFNENQDIMKQLDIRDEYELHNFYKKREDLLNSNVCLTRTPEFSIGDLDKKEFVKEILIEFSDQLLVECVDYLFEEYGFRKNTMNSYIVSNFRSYLENGRIKYNKISFKKDKMVKIKNLLVKPVYLKSEVIKIFNNVGLKLNSLLLGRLNYYITGNIIFEKKYKNVTGALSSIVMISDIWRRGNSPIELSNEMTGYLSHMERNRKLVVLDEGVYAKTSYLQKNGIYLNLLESFVESVYKFLPEQDYFSLFTLEKDNFKHPLIDLGFEKIFYERLLSTSSLFNPVNRISPILFAKEIENPVTLSKFFSFELSKYGKGIDIYDFRDELYDKYNIHFEIADIRYRLRKNDIYYSKNLEKLYIDKEIYLDEVYS